MCLGAMPVAGHSAEPGKDTRAAWLRASIVLDAAGRLTSLEWIGAKPNDRLVTRPLEAAIRDWEFEPGKVDGVPKATVTGLLLHVVLSKTPEGGLAINVDEARTGAVSLRQDPPPYPRDQAMRGAQATVVVQIDTDAAGQVASARMIEYDGSSKADNSRKDFEAAALKVVKSWAFLTEQVDGKGVAASMRAPISFCLDDRWCQRSQSTGEKAGPSGTAVAMDSVARIRTRTQRVGI